MAGVGIIRPLVEARIHLSHRVDVELDATGSRVKLARIILSGFTAYRLQIGQKIITDNDSNVPNVC